MKVAANAFSLVCVLILDLVLKRNLYVSENRTLQLDYLVNDTTYPGLEGTVLLHFNVTILPVHIRFANVTHMFTLTRRASVYAQVPVASCPPTGLCSLSAVSHDVSPSF